AAALGHRGTPARLLHGLARGVVPHQAPTVDRRGAGVGDGHAGGEAGVAAPVAGAVLDQAVRVTAARPAVLVRGHRDAARRLGAAGRVRRDDPVAVGGVRRLVV